MRPKARPKGMMKKKKAASNAPMSSIRPKARPNTIVTPEEAGAIERGNRAAKRRADEAMPMMKAGGMTKKGYKAGGMTKKGYKAGGKMPDLSGDGKVTQKDVLMGRGVIKKKAGGMMKKGYKKGGKIRGYGMARGGKVCKMR
jgi:hypothetical protein